MTTREPLTARFRQVLDEHEHRRAEMRVALEAAAEAIEGGESA